jgi:hypothetical protein
MKASRVSAGPKAYENGNCFSIMAKAFLKRKTAEMLATSSYAKYVSA